MSETLKPCPFCGSPGQQKCEEPALIECTDKECALYAGRAMHISKWNRRVPASDVQPPQEILDALDRMSKPLDESILKGATAREDARCMQVIRDHIMRASDVQEGRSVRIPTSADEAELMEKLGFQYLAEHAPERLTDDGQIRAAAQANAKFLEDCSRFAGKMVNGNQLSARAKAIIAALAAAQSPPSRQAEPEMVECEWSEDNQDGCPYCSGEACAQCVPHGDPPCEHDSFERHQRRPAAAPDTEQAQQPDYSVIQATDGFGNRHEYRTSTAPAVGEQTVPRIEGCVFEDLGHGPPRIPNEVPALSPNEAKAFADFLDGAFLFLSNHGWRKPVLEAVRGMQYLRALASAPEPTSPR